MGLSFNYFNPSEGFENELNAGLLFFPYGSLYVFLMSTMALGTLSLVMFIPFLFGIHSKSHSGTCGTPSHLTTSYSPLHPDLKRKEKKKHLCALKLCQDTLAQFSVCGCYWMVYRWTQKDICEIRSMPFNRDSHFQLSALELP